MTATDLFFVHALSPLHVGSGSSVDIVDLPLVRERSTGYPYIPGSSVKGALRSWVAARGSTGDEDTLFGFRKRGAEEDGDRDTFAGALATSDARLLILPVRASRAVFALTTSPIALRRLLRLAQEVGFGDERFRGALAELVRDSAAMPDDAAARVAPGSLLFVAASPRLDLEDMETNLQVDERLEVVGAFLARNLLAEGEDDYLTRRLCLLPDDTFRYFAEHATEVVARVRIDPGTRTVQQGALWNEEYLPAESVLVGAIHSFGSRRPKAEALDGQGCLDLLWRDRTHIVHSFGGKETTGHGRVRLARVRGG
ncbi:type III-B CRISPR module RAMP protein Cmr4 [Myxococcota bacterium]|nr:type III-B CRISPR module RAMP protein Cmr4 [Myxococcota bacterium]